MKYLKEYKYIDWDDWDDEEEDPNDDKWYTFNKNLPYNIIQRLKVGVSLNTTWSSRNNVLIENYKGQIIAVEKNNSLISIQFEHKIYNGHTGIHNNGKNQYCWDFHRMLYTYNLKFQFI